MDNATALGRTAIAVEHAGGLRLERDAVHCDAVDQDMRLRLAWLDSDLRRGAGLERQSVDRDAVPVAGRIVRDIGREHPDRLAVDEDLELAGVAVSALADAERERVDRRSEEHTSELQSLMRISYAVFCLKKKKQNKITLTTHTYH